MGEHAHVGRVRSSHQIFVVSMLAGSLVWLLLLVGALAPGLPNIMLDLTPHPAFIDRSLVRLAFLVGLVIVPLGVGLAGYLVPADGERPGGLRAGVEVLRGYLLTPVLAGLMLFLPAVGILGKSGACVTTGRTRTSRSWPGDCLRPARP